MPLLHCISPRRACTSRLHNGDSSAIEHMHSIYIRFRKIMGVFFLGTTAGLDTGPCCIASSCFAYKVVCWVAQRHTRLAQESCPPPRTLLSWLASPGPLARWLAAVVHSILLLEFRSYNLANSFHANANGGPAAGGGRREFAGFRTGTHWLHSPLLLPQSRGFFVHTPSAPFPVCINAPLPRRLASIMERWGAQARRCSGCSVCLPT